MTGPPSSIPGGEKESRPQTVHIVIHSCVQGQMVLVRSILALNVYELRFRQEASDSLLCQKLTGFVSGANR